MKLYEYEAKNILKTYGISSPRGEIASTPNEACEIAEKLKAPFVVKAQALVTGRGKAGGILFGENSKEVRDVAKSLFGSQIKGFAVKKVLVEEKETIFRELYLGITIDRAERKYVIITSAKGGVDIEFTAAQSGQSITKTLINPQQGFDSSNAKQIARKMGYRGSQLEGLAHVIDNLYRASADCDAELLEVNPLIETDSGKFVALDARLIIDDNSLFRHKELEMSKDTEDRGFTLQEVKAARNGLAYVKLNGNIGVISNGAGLVMATLDMVQLHGGEAANFLDLGGGAPIERVTKALKIVISEPAVKVILINILGGLTKCDDVARAIIKTKNDINTVKPFIVRLAGTNEEGGRQILEQAGIPVLSSMEEAAKHAVDIMRRDINWE